MACDGTARSVVVEHPVKVASSGLLGHGTVSEVGDLDGLGMAHGFMTDQWKT
jgi:hypothetical protein